MNKRGGNKISWTEEKREKQSQNSKEMWAKKKAHRKARLEFLASKTKINISNINYKIEIMDLREFINHIDEFSDSIIEILDKYATYLITKKVP